jgi:hypothetical protein
MERTWLVMCPKWKSKEHTNKAQGWALFKKALKAISTDYFNPKIECIICGEKFSLQQGVSEAFSSDIVIDDFRYNSHESGTAEVTVGKLTKIDFKEPFLDIPEVNLTPYLKPVNAVTGYITSKGFAIFSCANGRPIEEKCQINWHASGNRDPIAFPLWRQLLSNSKDQQKSENFRSEIVELESAFEVFFSEYLAKNLRGRLNQRTINWLLSLNVNTQLTIGYREITGKEIQKQFPTEHGRWNNCVKHVRDLVAHQGMTVTPKQSSDARKALFNFLTRIDSSAMEQFQIQMKDIGIDGPHLSFGMAHGTGKQQAIKHGLKK